jgi:spore coat polysaccharide biosynthesis protein SpsF
MTVICTVAMRMGSERLPGKSLIEIAGQPLMGHLIDRLQACHRLDGIVIATTDLAADDPIEEYAASRQVPCFRGAAEDVLDRITQASQSHEAKICVVVYGDGPLIDPQIIDGAVEMFIESESVDFLGNDLQSTFPSGMEVEVMSMQALAMSHSLCQDAATREHGTLFLRQHPNLFRVKNFEAQGYQRRPDLYLEVDEPVDLPVVESIARHLQKQGSYALDTIIELVDEQGLSRVNSHILRRWQQFR